MSYSQLQRVIGAAKLEELTGVIFQHASRSGFVATFLRASQSLQFKASERAAPRRYRKGQVHPDVFLSCFSSALSCCNVPLGNNECLVVLTGGTPEAVAAGIVLGYKKVVYVAGPKELEMMKLPSPAQERELSIDYDAYASPDVDKPQSGMLAALLVRQLAPFIRDHVNQAFCKYQSALRGESVLTSMLRHNAWAHRVSNADACLYEYRM